MLSGRLRGCIVGCAALLTLTGCLFAPLHDVTAPDKPSGLTVGLVGEALPFSVAGAVCTRNHVLLYQWDWGNGELSDWVTGSAVSHAWGSPGTYAVKARARCQESSAVESAWSAATAVSILPFPTPSSTQ